jgi:hypothetical protein
MSQQNGPMQQGNGMAMASRAFSWGDFVLGLVVGALLL